MKKFGRVKPKTIQSVQQGVVVNAGLKKLSRLEAVALQPKVWILK